MISRDSLLQVKKDVEDCIGQEIYIRANMGRNRKIQTVGTIDSVFPNLFVIQEQDTLNKSTYTYTDLLTNSLEMTKLESGESVINHDYGMAKKYTGYND